MVDSTEPSTAEATLKRERMIFNERVKLVAGAFNTLGTGALAAGLTIPFVNYFWSAAGAGSGSGVGSSVTVGSFLVAFFIWLAVLIVLNVAGLLVLGLMREL